MEEEIWKDVVGYDGLYQVSNLGRVKSFYNGKERILKPVPNGGGYLKVILYKDGKRTTKKIHRLVAEAFIPNPEKRDDVDHINTIRTDNRLENLRWCTRRENCNNPKSIEHYSNKFGKEHNRSIPILQYSLDGELIGEWHSMTDVYRKLGIKCSNICNCCKGRLKSSGGYRWKYKN